MWNLETVSSSINNAAESCWSWLILYWYRKAPREVKKTKVNVVKTWISSFNGVHLVFRWRTSASLCFLRCVEPRGFISLFNEWNVYSEQHPDPTSVYLVFSGWKFVLKLHPTEDHTAGCAAQGADYIAPCCLSHVSAILLKCRGTRHQACLRVVLFIVFSGWILQYHRYELTQGSSGHPDTRSSVSRRRGETQDASTNDWNS